MFCVFPYEQHTGTFLCHLNDLLLKSPLTRFQLLRTMGVKG